MPLIKALAFTLLYYFGFLSPTIFWCTFRSQVAEACDIMMFYEFSGFHNGTDFSILGY